MTLPLGVLALVVALAPAAVAAGAESAAGDGPPRVLTIDERAVLEMRVQEVLARHRTGGGERRRPPASLQTYRRQVVATLKQAEALETRWHRPIGAVELQAELDRLAACTRDPELLQEIYEALDGDPVLVAECLAMPLLARRKFADYYAWDREIHAEVRQEAAAAAVAARARGEEVWIRETPSGFVVSDGPRSSHDEDGRETDPSAHRIASSRKATREAWLLGQPEPRPRVVAGLEAVVLRMPGSGVCTQDGFNEGPPASSVTRDYDLAWTGPEVWVGAFAADDGKPGVGALYQPATDTWRSMSSYGTASGGGSVGAWTGEEVLLWHSGSYSGLRYDVAADRWSSIPQYPGTGDGRSCVWTGSELIVWGGGIAQNELNTGSRYDPGSGTWTPTTLQGAPSPRSGHSAVWSGSEMLVWGGYAWDTAFLADGGAYDPAVDAWRPMAGAGAPAERSYHQAVWTGSLMVVWGGGNASGLLPSGGRYTPSIDSWSPMATAGAPPLTSVENPTVWSGAHVFLWDRSGEAGRYDPVADLWSPVSAAGSPGPRQYADIVWTGAEVMVYGGQALPNYAADGGVYLYDPALDRWRPGYRGTAVEAKDRTGFASVWTGVEMIVWGGLDGGGDPIDSGGRYLPAMDAWIPTSTDGEVPGPGGPGSFLWTGSEMIVYGPSAIHAAYAPATDSWRTIVYAPPGVADARAAVVWSGNEMIYWGGLAGSTTNLGARYDPVTDSWTLMTTVNAPTGRASARAVWTGDRMLVYGGYATGSGSLSNGGAYDPVTDTWALFSGLPIPGARTAPSVVWTGSEMIVWGGLSSGGLEDTGAAYDPVAGTWRPTEIATNTAAPRYRHTAVWTGQEMIVWGGKGATPSLTLGDGARYDPSSGSWMPVTLVEAPWRRWLHAAVWTGSEMVIFGGGELDGGRYDPPTDRWIKGWRGGTAIGEDVLAGKSSGGGAAPYGAGIRGYRIDGRLTPTLVDAFPGQAGFGVKVAGGDVVAGSHDEVVAGPGPGPTFLPRLRGFSRDAMPLASLDLVAYGTGGYGVNVGTGAIDGAVAALTGPGPSPVFGPHVRAFRAGAAGGSSVAKVSFYAYGTLRYGAGAGGGELDADGFDEIVTGAGPGAVFGPHVRGWDHDGVSVAPIPAINFYAYATLRYGVDAEVADLEGDARAEIVTGPGPSVAFGPHLRGFRRDGGPLGPMPGINTFVFPGALHGLDAGSADMDGDGMAEIACGAGPDPAFGSRMAAYQHDGAALAPIPALALDVYGLAYGVRVAGADTGY